VATYLIVTGYGADFGDDICLCHELWTSRQSDICHFHRL